MSFYDDTPNYGGGSSGGSKSVSQIFFDPLKDIAKTASYATQYMTTKVKNAAKQIVGTLAAGLLPFTDRGGELGVTRAFNSLKQKELSELGKIDSQYGSVLKRNIEALQNADVLGLAFLLNPKAALVSKLLLKAPGASLGILDMITGGAASNAIKSISSGGSFQKSSSGESHHSYFSESVQENSQENIKLGNEIAKAIQTPEIQKKIDSSDFVKATQQLAAKILVDRASLILSSKNFDELSKQIGAVEDKDLKTKLGELIKTNQIPQQQAKNFETALFQELKNSIKMQFVEGITKLQKLNPQAANILEQAKTQIKQIQ